MSYPRYGDRWYKVLVRITTGERTTIKATVGEYRNTANAIFGSLRKLKVDADSPEFVTAVCQLLPPKPPRMAKAAYTRKLRQEHEAL